MRLHDIAVQSIIDRHPRSATIGFSKAAAAIIGERFPETIIPDAWMQDPASQVLKAFEVEDGHPVRHEKMLRYTRLFWWLEDFDWDLQLWVCSRWGDDLRQIDLLAYDLRSRRLTRPGAPAQQ